LAEQEVKFSETWLNSVARKVGLNISEVGARVAGVDINSLTEKFFYFGNERMLSRQIEAREGDIGSLKAAGEWRRVV
jgi:hypothetical protein